MIMLNFFEFDINNAPLLVILVYSLTNEEIALQFYHMYVFFEHV